MLDPLLKCSPHIERICTRPTSAMSHSRHHEQPIKRVYLCSPSQCFCNILVVVDAAPRWNIGITEAMIMNQFSATALEWPQFRVRRVEDRSKFVIDERCIRLEVEGVKIPVRVC